MSRKLATLLILLALSSPAFASTRPAAPVHQPTVIEAVVAWIKHLVPGSEKAVRPIVTPTCGAGIDPTGNCV